MLNQKYKIVLAKSADFVDNSKTGNARFDAKMGPGEFTATLIPNPSGDPDDSNWLMFDNTSIGATVEYVKTKATITALS